jgi:hypothetical protein
VVDPSRVWVTGPLAEFSEGLRDAMAELGFTPRSVRDQTYVLAHLSRWLAAEDVGPSALTSPVVQRFLQTRRRAGRRRWVSVRSVRPLLDYLHRVGVAPVWEAPAPSGPVERLQATATAMWMPSMRARCAAGSSVASWNSAVERACPGWSPSWRSLSANWKALGVRVSRRETAIARFQGHRWSRDLGEWRRVRGSGWRVVRGVGRVRDRAAAVLRLVGAGRGRG